MDIHFYSIEVFILTKIQQLLHTYLGPGYLHVHYLIPYNLGNCGGVVCRSTTRESAAQDFGSRVCKFSALCRNERGICSLMRMDAFLCNHKIPSPTSDFIFLLFLFVCFSFYLILTSETLLFHLWLSLPGT